jgi:hypothetical protein
MDHATASIDAITNGDQYAVVPGVPIFDAHDEYDANNKLIRRFDLKRLSSICERSNRRAEETGDLSPSGPGHTVLDGRETDQPPIYAYAKNYRVGKFGPQAKDAILVDFFVKKRVDDGRGNEVDGVRAFHSYPRRSVELWMKDGFIDWIALLRTTPKRDLGLLAYSKGHRVAVPKTDTLYGSLNRRRSLTAAVRRGKLCYSMETSMDPVMPADSAGPDADFEAKIDQYLASKFPHLQEMYDEQAAKFDSPEPPLDAPGGDMPIPGTDLDAPGGDTPAEPPIKFSKTNPKSVANRLLFLEAELAKATAALAATAKDRKIQAEKFSRADAEARVDRLEVAGVELDRDEEVLSFSKLPVDGDAREKYETKLARFHKRGQTQYLPPSGFVETESPTPMAGELTKAELDKVTHYMRANKVGFEDAVARYKK